MAPEVALRSCGLLHGLSDDASCGKILKPGDMMEPKHTVLQQDKFEFESLEDKNMESWEQLRQRNLSIARLQDGWDQVHALYYSG